ncbi:MAG: hypothetical protein WD534_16080 [Phycisphaeraceae bacterium]
MTSAAGFIGCDTVAALNACGRDDLLLVDKLGADEKWRNLPGLRYEDLLEPDVFLHQVEEGGLDPPETVIHLGACSSATIERDADYLPATATTTRAPCASGASPTAAGSSMPPARERMGTARKVTTMTIR